MLNAAKSKILILMESAKCWIFPDPATYIHIYNYVYLDFPRSGHIHVYTYICITMYTLFIFKESLQKKLHVHNYVWDAVRWINSHGLAHPHIFPSDVACAFETWDITFITNSPFYRERNSDKGRPWKCIHA